MPKHLIIALDIGGTKIHAGLLQPNGTVLARAKIPTEAGKGRAAVMANIERAVQEVWRKDVRAIGVGMAGAVDARRGVYLRGPNLPVSFRNVPVAALLKKRFRVPVVVDNDAHCFALGEAIFGAGRGKNLVVGITLGTGVGGGIVMDGTVLRGKNNTAGEIGHTRIGSGGASFENSVSGTAMTRLYHERTGRTEAATTIERLSLDGDRAAGEVVAAMQDAFITGIANLLHTFDPDIIVVGGGLRRMKALWRGLKPAVRKHLVYPTLAQTPVVPAKLGDDAMLLGAALLTGRLRG